MRKRQETLVCLGGGARRCAGTVVHLAARLLTASESQFVRLLLQPTALLGAGWRAALLWGGAAAAALAVARVLLAVQHESLIYIRLLGVRLSSKRRCGLWGTSRFLPLRQLSGIIIHEVGAGSRRG